jgi:hypothetical protein
MTLTTISLSCKMPFSGGQLTALFPRSAPGTLAKGEQEYQYEPLSIERQQIRLLRVDRRHQSPRFELGTFDFADAPPYKALSYTWGAPKPTRQITVNGSKLTIRRNLYHFLCMFTGHNFRHVYLWVDQICIDQQNLVERSSQVQFMVRISARVVAVF